MLHNVLLFPDGDQLPSLLVHNLRRFGKFGFSNLKYMGRKKDRISNSLTNFVFKNSKALLRNEEVH
jgi:hypothetical protein